MSRNPAAIQVAKKVINYARNIKYPNSETLHCHDCRHFPVLPVTGFCGHTRCTTCIEKNGSCFCGCSAPVGPLHVNILVQRLLDKILRPDLRQGIEPFQSTAASTSSGITEQADPPMKRSRDQPYSTLPYDDLRHRLYTDSEIQYQYAQGLVVVGQYRDAAPLLANVAATQAPIARKAHNSLILVIEELLKTIELRYLTRELFRAVRAKLAVAWVEPSDLECVICFGILKQPITTPCGHTFCRECILRTITDNKHCPVCRRPLDNLSIVLTSDTSFVAAALLAIAPPPRLDSAVVPLFRCLVAYPALPSPILVLGPSYWAMIERVLESGTKKVGMVAGYQDGSFAISGTIVEVRDCVRLRDGHTMLTVVGISRFQTIEECIEKKSHVARIIDLEDIPDQEQAATLKLNRMAKEIADKLMIWLSTLSGSVLLHIEWAYGPMPMYLDEDKWWANPHGPKWLWWIIAILPLGPQIQVLMLATTNLQKRMMAVSRTLDIINHIFLPLG